MADALRVILELGRKRRIVAAAIDWPGLDRWGTSEGDALARLSAYLPRYAGVAERASRADEFRRATDLEVVERVPGSSSTDFWGVAHIPSLVEAEVLTLPALDRRLDLLQAAWAFFDHTAATVSAELRPGPRSAGRSREQVIRHVVLNEPEQFSRKVEVRTEPGTLATPDGLAAHRAAFLGAIRAYNAGGRPARTWPIQFLIRRTANHVMDHAWELQDRDTGATEV
jgi:hypothetical protein